MDFAEEPLLTEHDPIEFALDSNPVSAYEKLRNAIATRLTNGTDPLVAPALIAKLQGTSIGSGDPVATKGYKCGWLNMVYFATLDLLRVETLLKLGCDRTTSRPGVVLGWVRQVGSVWVFDCAYRHAWEPPRGLTEAFFGGTCNDPASRYRDDLEALLAGYAPPAPPPSGGGSGPVVVQVCPDGSPVVRGVCWNIVYPPKKIPDNWREKFKVDKLAPIWNPPNSTWDKASEIYEIDEVNFFNDGVISTVPFVGLSGDAVKGALEAYIKLNQGVPDVNVVTFGQEPKTGAGYLPAGGFSPSDSLFISVDSQKTVVATGRVPAVRNTRNVGNQLPTAVKAAADAKAAADELRGVGAVVEDRFAALTTDINGVNSALLTLTSDFNAYKGGAFDQGGFGARLRSMEQKVEQFRLHGERISDLEGRVAIIGRAPMAGAAVTPKGMDTAVGKGISQFAATTLNAMKSLPAADNREFIQNIEAVEQSQAQLTAAIEAENQQAIAAAALSVLGTMGLMVKSAGVSPELGQQLDAQLNQLGGLLG
jgi:hypothetical protein